MKHMRFCRADALSFFRVQNLVDEKFRGVLVVCYENVPVQYLYTERNHPQGKIVRMVINCSQPELYLNVEQQTGRGFWS